MLLKAGNLNYHVECFKIWIHLNSKKFKIHKVDMHLTLISGMGFLDRIFFSFALNTQNVNYLHKKYYKTQVWNEGKEKKLCKK